MEKELGESVRSVMGRQQGASERRSASGMTGRLSGDGYPADGRTGRIPSGAAPSGTENVPDTEELIRAQKKRQRRKNFVYYAVAYFFVLIFLALIGYMIYFNLKLRDNVLRSPYNKRQDAQAKYTTRGKIVSIDGTVLAYTDSHDDGEEYRVYPEGRAFSHVIGYDTHGKSGVESIANYELLATNEPITQQIINDFSGKKNDGDTVVVTLDAAMQRCAYESLGEYQGAVVALDAKTGALLAMVSKPDFDPNTIASAWNDIIGEEGSSVLVNRATQGRYAPGSTFKIVTALAYYRKFGSTERFFFDCDGEIEAGEHTIHCSNGAEHGEQNLMEAFTNSCNCAFASMGKEVGVMQLKNTAESLLFNTKLPTADLAGNNSSFNLDPAAEDFLIMQTSFGQGKTLTSPYHMALIAAAVANDGVLMQPYLVDHVENIAGTVVSRKSPKEYKRLLTDKETIFLSGLLRKVVTEGTASALADRSYTAYGKTGSAEFGRSDGTLGTHSWFTGYAEKDGRKIAVAVLAEGAGSGSGTAVPIARNMFDTYFN